MLVPNKPVKGTINGCKYMKVIYVDPLPVGLLAQLVERCSDIAKVVGSNPVQS